MTFTSAEVREAARSSEGDRVKAMLEDYASMLGRNEESQRRQDEERERDVRRRAMIRQITVGTRVTNSFRGGALLHGTVLKDTHPDELDVRLDDGTRDQWMWRDKNLRIEGDEEADV